MRYRLSAGIAGFSLVAGLLTINSLSANTVPISMAAECTATTDQALVVREGEQDLRVAVSEALADSVRAEVTKESNLKINGVEKSVDNKNFTVKVDASSATPGTWSLTLTSEATSCNGQVRVVAAK